MGVWSYSAQMVSLATTQLFITFSARPCKSFPSSGLFIDQAVLRLLYSQGWPAPPHPSAQVQRSPLPSYLINPKPSLHVVCMAMLWSGQL